VRQAASGHSTNTDFDAIRMSGESSRHTLSEFPRHLAICQMEGGNRLREGRLVGWLVGGVGWECATCLVLPSRARGGWQIVGGGAENADGDIECGRAAEMKAHDASVAACVYLSPRCRQQRGFECFWLAGVRV